MATATRARQAQGSNATPRAAELVRALERTLAEADADDRVGPAIAATHLRLRIELTDLDLALNIASDEGDHNLSWSFDDDPGWTPKLVLRMPAAVANRYLQGRESLAIAIARGEVRCRGESRAALLYLPAARLLAEPYRRVVEDEFPALVTA
jgi:hypothetical protein